MKALDKAAGAFLRQNQIFDGLELVTRNTMRDLETDRIAVGTINIGTGPELIGARLTGRELEFYTIPTQGGER